MEKTKYGKAILWRMCVGVVGQLIRKRGGSNIFLIIKVLGGKNKSYRSPPTHMHWDFKHEMTCNNVSKERLKREPSLLEDIKGMSINIILKPKGRNTKMCLLF